MDREEEERRVKQTYLRTEILDKGYDAERFVDFMGSLRENGMLDHDAGEDLENWTFEDLRTAVSDFQKANPGVSPVTGQDGIEDGGQKPPKSGVILEDSDEEDIRYQPEIRTRDRGITDPLHDEFIGRSSAGMDTQPSEPVSYESESEKKRKALLAVALEAKKATIVGPLITTGVRCHNKMHQNTRE